jgi:hypothetical protein
MKPKTRNPHTQPRGFALIVTLSLMILLTVIAVGLLSLSSISLRTTSQGSAMAVARSNAKLALMLAIGELQKTAGPDKRITAPANLVNSAAPAGITGVWNSWRPPFTNPDYTSAKTGANFLGYLMSNPNPGTPADPAVLPTATGNVQSLVGVNSVGTTNPAVNQVSAPLVPITNSKNSSGAMAYVTLDEGVKGRIDLMPGKEPEGLGETVTQVGAPARNGFETVEKLDFLNKERAELEESLPKLVSLNQANLQATAKDAIQPFFHDFTIASNSLQTDVANGGLKTDLSVLFDGNYGTSVNSAYSNRYLYSDTNTPFQGTSTTSDVQWSLYANYSRLYRKTTNKDNPKDGLKAALPPGYQLKPISDTAIKKTRYEPNMVNLKQPMLMPTVVRVDTVFSLVTRDNHHKTPGFPYMLHLMYLPVITLHNPYNVPLRVTNLQVEFSDIPVAFEFLINDQPVTTSGLTTLNQFYVDAADQGAKKSFSMLLSNSLSAGTEVMMGAGETRIFGTPFSATSTWAAELSANGYTKGMMFDWQSNQTAAAYTMPGMMTPSNIGVGFDVDWLVPSNASAWYVARKGGGILALKSDDKIKVRYGPKAPTTANNSFAVTVRMGAGTAAPEAARTQVFYLNDSRLKTIVEEGVSPRFPDARSFPETCPRSTESAITTMNLYEPNTYRIKEYAKARPFAVFSVSGKTTMESFTKSRPVTDTGIAFQMATCDFTTAASAGASPLEFALVPVINNSAAVESGGIQDANRTSLQGFFFGGHGSGNGTTNATFYEIPKAPLQSIAQLRHANGGSLGAVPFVTYTIGESRSHPAVPSSATFVKPNASRTVLDRSWLANDQLWDKYWFSTLATLQGVAYTGSSSFTQEELANEFFAGTKSLPNPRNTPYVSGGKSTADVATSAITAGGAKSASHILTQGGFNVNSTSVAAWTSVLSALSSSDVPLAAGTTEKDPNGTPFLRMRQPVGESSMVDKEKIWNGYRTLDKDDIADLAQEIVAEVKARGPFLSMSEFVNRRLGSANDPLSTKGAIQAALDRTDVNDIMGLNSRTVSPAEVGTYGWDNKNAVERNTGAGAPGEVSQGDILSSVGSFISVRSDTFRVRAFGDARNSNGQVIARAWCEATVQRIPEYVDSADLPEAVATAAANITFGRQFNVISFRWLHPDEV